MTLNVHIVMFALIISRFWQVRILSKRNSTKVSLPIIQYVYCQRQKSTPFTHKTVWRMMAKCWQIRAEEAPAPYTDWKHPAYRTRQKWGAKTSLLSHRFPKSPHLLTGPMKWPSPRSNAFEDPHMAANPDSYRLAVAPCWETHTNLQPAAPQKADL